MPLGTSCSAKRLTADDDRVARVVPALVADHDLHLLGDEVGELALALVAPLRADHDGCGHRAMVLNAAWDADGQLPCHFWPRSAGQNGLHMSTPAVSVIVPMRNAAEHVLEQVTALANQTAPGIDFEVIWVDNGSSDGTLQLVTESIRNDNRMRVVSAPEVQSSYFARNRGVALAEADVLLFCDADDVVDVHWVQSMASALAELDVVGGALMLDSDDASGRPRTGSSASFRPRPPPTSESARAAFEALGASTARFRPVRTSRCAGERSFEASGSASRPTPSCSIGGDRPSGHE